MCFHFPLLLIQQWLSTADTDQHLYYNSKYDTVAVVWLICLLQDGVCTGPKSACEGKDRWHCSVTLTHTDTECLVSGQLQLTKYQICHLKQNPADLRAAWLTPHMSLKLWSVTTLWTFTSIKLHTLLLTYINVSHQLLLDFTGIQRSVM